MGQAIFAFARFPSARQKIRLFQIELIHLNIGQEQSGYIRAKDLKILFPVLYKEARKRHFLDRSSFDTIKLEINFTKW